MAQPYIRINQFGANYSDVGVKSATEHVNFTFIDGNGVNYATLALGTCEPEVQKFVVQNLQIASPIVINLDGLGIQTTSIFEQSVQFDLLGIGHKVTSSWIMPTSGFLVYNKQGMDSVSSVNDLFGGSERMEGFFKLADLDKGKKGYIDQNDEIYASLRVWVNHQMDGISHAGEIFTLQELGVERINTGFDIIDFLDENNNLIGERSTAIINGVEHEMSEVYFTYL